MLPTVESLIGSVIRNCRILGPVPLPVEGIVVRAKHESLNEERAIQFIDGRLTAGTDFVGRFLHEARILAKLRHPNLVRFYEFGALKEDILFAIFEILEGQTVKERVRRSGRFPAVEALGILRQAVLGLHTAHLHEIHHREVTPQNLLLVKEGAEGETAKIINFRIGTLSSNGKDIRDEIRNLGSTFYQMLTGTLLASTSLSGAGLNEPPSHFSSQVSEDLDRFVLKMLKGDHASMTDLLQELEALQDLKFSVSRVSSSDSVTHVLLPPGHLFAQRYLIEKKIGQGGMGRVYKATDRVLEVPVALKVLEATDLDSEKVTRFKREVIVARKVTHPNACRIYDMGDSGGILYVSMEYLEGKTLAEILRVKKRLAPEEGISIIRQVLLALQNAHREGVIHRDIKPENIMVDNDGNAHLMDFGLSISLDWGRMTQTGAIVGTPHYMAPEQFEGKNIDHRVDIYAIGVILFRMFTGRIPFHSDTPAGVISAHMKTPVPKPSEFAPDIPPELETIIMTALEKDPQNRYQNVRDLLQALKPFSGMQTNLQNVTLEHEAQRLLADHNYGKAARLLRILSKNQPQNDQIPKLLEMAELERIKRMLRRTRNLIREENLIQAKLLLEKISSVPVQSTHPKRHVEQLHEELTGKIEATVSTYLMEAQKALDMSDWNKAESTLLAAKNLKTEDGRIQALQKILDMEKRDEDKPAVDLTSEFNEVSKLFESKAYESALRKVEYILERNPYFFEAMQWKDRIEKVIRGSEFEGAFETGKSHFHNKDWRNAVRFFETALQIHPNADVQALLTEAEKQLRQKDSAQKATLEQENLEPPPPDPIAETERTEFKAEEKKETDRKFQKAIRLVQEKQWGPAVDSFRKLREEHPENTSYAEYLSLCEANLQKLSMLREKMRSAVLESQEYASKGHWEEAIACVNMALQTDTGDFGVHEEIVALQIQMATVKSSRTQHALEDADKAYRQGEINRAKILYQAVINRDPENDTAWARLREIRAREQAEAERPFLARILPEQLLVLLPWFYRVGVAVLLLAIVTGALSRWPIEALVLWKANRSVQSNRKEEAIQELKNYLDRNPSAARSRDLYHTLVENPLAAQITPVLEQARKLRDSRKYEGAAKLYESVLQMDPSNQEARGELEYINRLKTDFEKSFQKAETSYNNKNYEAAWTQINEVLTLSPQNPSAIRLMEEIRKRMVEARVARARELLKQNKYGESLALLEEAQALDVSNMKLRAFEDEVTIRRDDEVARLIQSAQKLYQKKKYPEAVSELEKAIALDNTNQEAQNLLKEISHLQSEK